MKKLAKSLIVSLLLTAVAVADFNPGPFKIWDGTNSIVIDASGRQTVLQGGSWSFSLGAAIPAGTNLIGKFGIDQTTQGTTNFVTADQTKVNGVAVSVNTGASDTGTQRVVLANESIIQDVTKTGASITSLASNWNIVEAGPTVNATDCLGYRSLSIQFVGVAVSSTTLNFEGSNDNTNFFSVPMYDKSVPTATPSVSASPSGSPMNKAYEGPIYYRYFRARLSALTATSVQAYTKLSTIPFATSTSSVSIASSNVSTNIAQVNAVTVLTGSGATGTGSPRVTLAGDTISAASTANPAPVGGRVTTTLDTTLVQGDAAALNFTDAGQVITKQYGSAGNDWTYAAASGGILNTTTAVTVKAAGAASIRNYITGLQVMSEALGTATELAVRDGAAGTVLWRIKVPTGGLPMTEVAFPTPLKGTAATLLEVVTLTATTTGAVYINLQGYTSF